MISPATVSVAGLLILATVTHALWSWLRPKSAPLFPHQRVKAWWAGVAVFLMAILGGPTVTILSFALLSFITLREYLHHLPRRLSRQTHLICYLAIALQYWWIEIHWYGMFVVFIPVFLFLYLPTTNSFRGEASKELLADQSMLHWGMMTTVFCLSHAAYLLVLVPNGPSLLLFVSVLTEVADGVRFLLKRFPAEPKLSAPLSVLASLIFALIFGPLLTPMSWPHIALAGFVLGLAGVVGNVNISAVSKELKMVPGGKLARIESLATTAPLFFHGFRYFYTV